MTDYTIDELLNTLVRVCVFAHTSRNWEDYENMYLDREALDSLKSWIIVHLEWDVDSIDNKIKSVSQSQFASLKTDWSIGRALVTNSVAMLGHEGKSVIHRYIESEILKLTGDSGIEKSVNSILNEL